jgi:hypothetical protein
VFLHGAQWRAPWQITSLERCGKSFDAAGDGVQQRGRGGTPAARIAALAGQSGQQFLARIQIAREIQGSSFAAELIEIVEMILPEPR